MLILLEHEWDQADFRLFRLMEWAGVQDYKKIVIANGGSLPEIPRSSVIVTLGPRAFEALGFHGDLDANRGYPCQWRDSWVVPTVSAKFIQGGNAKMSAAFINDVQKARDLTQNGQQPIFLSYLMDPSPLQALQWAEEYRRILAEEPDRYLAFDIETPGKGDEDELDLAGEKDQTWNIERIGFSHKEHSALSIPWEPQYFAAIRLCLGSQGPKVVWNAGFDVPRLQHAAFPISGQIHDGMVAWHILHSDLPKRLRFVATFTCPSQPAWKHLSGSRPAFYNATDADVEYRSMVAIERELRETGLWDVYQRDVLDLEPVLQHMTTMGMPIDQDVRFQCALKLADELDRLDTLMTSCVPLEARRIDHIYVNTPKDLTGLLERPGTRMEHVCTTCGAARPRKDHFKHFKKKLNPCAGGSAVERSIDVTEYYRLAPFKPSRDQLQRYHQWLRRPLPMVYDKAVKKKKVSFAEKQLKQLRLKYPDDPLYAVILDYRSIDKLAGTYVGRPV